MGRHLKRLSRSSRVFPELDLRGDRIRSEEIGWDRFTIDMQLLLLALVLQLAPAQVNKHHLILIRLILVLVNKLMQEGRSLTHKSLFYPPLIWSEVNINGFKLSILITWCFQVWCKSCGVIPRDVLFDKPVIVVDGLALVTLSEVRAEVSQRWTTFAEVIPLKPRICHDLTTNKKQRKTSSETHFRRQNFFF